MQNLIRICKNCGGIKNYAQFKHCPSCGGVKAFIKDAAFILVIVVVTATVAYSASAALTLNTTSVVSDGALTLTGAAASTWDIGANLLSLQTSNGAITTGTGTFTMGGLLKLASDIIDASGNELINFSSTANAVNEVKISNASTNTSPAISVSGDDTNIGLDISTKGTGDLTLSLANAARAVRVNTGNLRVGAGTESITLTGEDAYITGTLEVDGDTRLDGNLNLTGGGSGGDLSLAANKYIGFNNSDVRFRNSATDTMLFEGGNLVLNSGTKIAHTAATNHGVAFTLYNTWNVSDTTAKTMGVIPASANITSVKLLVSTGFNGGSGQRTVACGTTQANPTEYANQAFGIDTTSLYKTGDGGSMPVSIIGDVGGSNVTVYCKVTAAGDSTQGAGAFMVDYIID